MYRLNPDDLSRLTFMDHPIAYPIEQYMKVRDAYVEAAAQWPGVVSIYQMGGTSAPGISDLDLIVVLNGQAPPPAPALFSTGRLDTASQYIFMHPGAMVTTESVFEHLPVLIYAANLTHLWGREIQVNHGGINEQNVARANLIDHGTHLMHQLTKCVISRAVYVRRIIMALSSISHTLALVALAGIAVQDSWTHFVQDIQSLKVNWFDDPDRAKLIRLLEQGMRVMMEVLFAVDHHLNTQAILANPSSDVARDAVFYQSPNAFTLFSHRAQKMDRRDGGCVGQRGLAIKYKQHYLNTTLSVVVAPYSFVHQVAAYARGSSVLSQRLRSMIQNVSHEVSMDHDYASLLNQRVGLWSDNLEFLSKHRLLNFDVMPFPGSRRAFTGKSGLAAVVHRLRDGVVFHYNRRAFGRSIFPALQGQSQ